MMCIVKPRPRRCPGAWVTVITIILAALFLGEARAQEPAPPADPPPPVEGAGPDDPGPAAADPADVAARYQQALDAFSQGRFADAEALFREVGERSSDPLRRAIAEELARQAAARAARGTPGESPETPGATPPPTRTTRPEHDNARVRLLGTTLLLGLNYGWMVPLALDIDDGRAFTGAYMLTAGASFLGPYLATRDSRVSPAMASLGGGGAVLGLGHGALIYLLAEGTDGADDSIRGLFGSMIAASLLEGVSGYFWAKEADMKDGPANAALGGAAVGAGVAGALDFLVLGEDIEDLGGRGVAATLLLGSGLGIAGGYYAGKRRNYSDGDVYIVEVAGLLGTYLAATPLILFEPDDPRLVAGTLLAGASAGFLLGDRMVLGKEASKGQGMLIGLGTITGGLVGMGMGFLLSPENSDHLDDWLVVSSAIGATGGLAMMYLVVDIDEEAPAATTGPQLLGVTPWLGADDARGLGLLGRF